MRILVFIVFCLSLPRCNNSGQIKAQRLRDTIESLRRSTDYKPLDVAVAYDFINKYYLPRLDTMPTKRRIFIYPLTSRNFKQIFNEEKALLEAQYKGDTMIKTRKPVLFAPPPPFFDKQFNWDSKNLFKTKIIADTAVLMNFAKILRNFKAFHRAYGFGYMCISYPQYNVYTKRLIIY
jgi:hypothetical protein